MVFWITAALLTLGASLAVLMPLARAPKDARGNHDVEVYRDQLSELERDAGRGLIGSAEAHEARAEIARRLLRAAEPGARQPAPRTVWTRAAASAAVLSVPLLSWGIYASVGSPQLPPQPLQARLSANPAAAPVDTLIARAEQHLAANPQDGRGWEVLAPIYLRQGRFPEAVSAYRKAMELLGETPERQAALGESLAAGSDGVVSAEARAAFDRALRLDPGNPRARFFQAMALAQEGRVDDAGAAWRALLADLPQDSPWRDPTQQAVAVADSRTAAAFRPAMGRSAAQVETAQDLTPGERSAMIEEMVAGLSEKLRAKPYDPEGWLRLVRSYVVLGRSEAARDALRRGVDALGAGSDQARKFADAAAALGVTSAE